MQEHATKDGALKTALADHSPQSGAARASVAGLRGEAQGVCAAEEVGTGRTTRGEPAASDLRRLGKSVERGGGGGRAAEIAQALHDRWRVDPQRGQPR